MLESSWEKYATSLANAQSEDQLVQVYDDLVSKLKINLDTPANVVFARDTRASGSRLVEALGEALAATGANVTNYKFLTTPQLHYMVRCINTKDTQEEYGEASEMGYYEKLAAAFKQAMENVKPKGSITVDCANGVGGPKLKELAKHLQGSGLEMAIVNDDIHKPDSLNHEASGSTI